MSNKRNTSNYQVDLETIESMLDSNPELLTRIIFNMPDNIVTELLNDLNLHKSRNLKLVSGTSDVVSKERQPRKDDYFDRLKEIEQLINSFDYVNRKEIKGSLEEIIEKYSKEISINIEKYSSEQFRINNYDEFYIDFDTSELYIDDIMTLSSKEQKKRRKKSS